MRRRPVGILVFALACGGLSAHLGKQYLRAEQRVAPVAQHALTRVAVAARDLPVGAVLRAEDVKVIDWPSDVTPAGYKEASSALVGKELMFPVSANEPILDTKLAGESSIGGLSAAIPEGMLAVSVKADEVIAVGGFVVPGTHVDVLVTVSSTSDRPGLSRIALQNLKVLAAGQTFETNEQGEPQDASVVTLLVTPEQAEVLTLAASEGRVQLALRNGRDQSRPATPGALTQSLEGRRPAAAAPSAPPKAPPVVRQPTREAAVEIYHGSARTVSSF
jgi:pilus assembly protein CpaB